MIQSDLQNIKTLLTKFNNENTNKSYFTTTFEIENLLLLYIKKYQLNPVILEEIVYYTNMYTSIKQKKMKLIMNDINKKMN